VSVRKAIVMHNAVTASNNRFRDTDCWIYTGFMTEESAEARKSRDVLIPVSRSINSIFLKSGDVVRHVGGHASFQLICGATGNAMRAKALR
jgi:hypothetical protein